jgi:hypothetical protein
MRDPYADLEAAYLDSISRDPRRNPRPMTGVVPRTPSLDELDEFDIVPTGRRHAFPIDLPITGFHIVGDRRYE